jgi:hypothetical protein
VLVFDYSRSLQTRVAVSKRFSQPRGSPKQSSTRYAPTHYLYCKISRRQIDVHRREERQIRGDPARSRTAWRESHRLHSRLWLVVEEDLGKPHRRRNTRSRPGNFHGHRWTPGSHHLMERYFMVPRECSLCSLELLGNDTKHVLMLRSNSRNFRSSSKESAHSRTSSSASSTGRMESW